MLFISHSKRTMFSLIITNKRNLEPVKLSANITLKPSLTYVHIFNMTGQYLNANVNFSTTFISTSILKNSVSIPTSPSKHLVSLS